jgi:hypothetical protein
MDFDSSLPQKTEHTSRKQKEKMKLVKKKAKARAPSPGVINGNKYSEPPPQPPFSTQAPRALVLHPHHLQDESMVKASLFPLPRQNESTGQADSIHMRGKQNGSTGMTIGEQVRLIMVLSEGLENKAHGWMPLLRSLQAQAHTQRDHSAFNSSISHETRRTSSEEKMAGKSAESSGVIMGKQLHGTPPQPAANAHTSFAPGPRTDGHGQNVSLPINFQVRWGAGYHDPRGWDEQVFQCRCGGAVREDADDVTSMQGLTNDAAADAAEYDDTMIILTCFLVGDGAIPFVLMIHPPDAMTLFPSPQALIIGIGIERIHHARLRNRLLSHLRKEKDGELRQEMEEKVR